MSVTHNYEDMKTVMKDQGVTGMPIIIEDNVWIGAKAVILGRNRIESGAIIGAGAVVTKNVIANAVMAGVPAREIKNRGKMFSG